MAEVKSQKTGKMKGKKHSLFLSGAADSATEGGGGRKTSLKKYLRSKRKRRINPTDATENLKERSSTPLTSVTTSEPKQEYVRVVATVLHPEIFYKTLPITPVTSAYDVIVALVEKYAISMEDQNPDVFYLMETRENEQGSYSRVIEDTEKVYTVQSRWRDDIASHFTLSRKSILPRDDSILDNPFGAMVMSPSQDSYSSHMYSSFFGDGSLQFSQMSGMAFGVTSPTLVTSPTSGVAFGWGTPPGQIKSSQEQYTSLVSPPGTSYYAAIADSPVESVNSPSPLAVKMCMQKRTSSPEIQAKRELEMAHYRRQSDHSMDHSSPNMHSPQRGSPLHLNPLRLRPTDESKEQSKRMVGAQKRQVRLSWLVQQSIDEGMTSIMNRVISEQNPKSSITPQGSPQVQSTVKTTLPLATPSERQYPPYVFTPHRPKPAAKNQAMGKRYGLLQKANSEYSEQNISITNTTESSSEFESTRQPEPDDPEKSTSTEFHDYQKTTKSFPSVLFEAERTIHPTFGCNVGLYPSFVQCDHYSSQMDILESLSSLLHLELPKSTSKSRLSSDWNDPGKGALFTLENESNTQKDMKSKVCESSPEKQAVPSTSNDISPSLISPIRRGKLIEQAAKKVKLKKSHSFHLGDRQKDTKLSEKDATYSGSLISPSRRSRLIEQAALALRERRSRSLSLSQQNANKKKDDSSNLFSPPPHAPKLVEANGNSGESLNPCQNHPQPVREQQKSFESANMNTRSQFQDTANMNTQSQFQDSDNMKTQSQFQNIASTEAECTDCFDAIPRLKTVTVHRRQRSLGSIREQKHPPPRTSGTHWSHPHYGSLGSVNVPPPTRRLSDFQQCLKTSPVVGIGPQSLDPSQKSASYKDIPQRPTTQVCDIAGSMFDRASTRYRSLEALSNPLREVLYTPSARKRPMTLIVCRRHSSSSTLH